MYTEVLINTDTGEVIIREPYKVIDWTLPEMKGAKIDEQASTKRGAS